MTTCVVGYREISSKTVTKKDRRSTFYWWSLSFSENKILPTRPGDSLHDFSLLIKPTGAACNLACQYCFYLDKASLYPGSHLRMKGDVLEAAIQQRLSSPTMGEIGIHWQGGEPTLMGLEFYQQSVELVKRYKKPKQRVAYSIQTNGTLLNEHWGAFFKKFNFLVGLSMDGTEKMHNTYREDKGGNGSFERVKQAWEILQEYKVDTNILCTVHAANASHALETYRFFRDTLGARFIQFIPIVERVKDDSGMGEEESSNHAIEGHESIDVFRAKVGPRSVNPEQFGRFLTEIFDEWVRHDVGRVFIQNFEAALASWRHLPARVCIFQQVCGSSLVLEHNGDMYSCDHFVDHEHRLGNILERPMTKIARSDQQRRFGLDKRLRLPADCKKCDVLFACRGECPRNRFISTPDGEMGLNYLCPSYKLFFRHIDQSMRHMAGLLKRGRAAAEIMDKT
jgi:uncharacterized protein